MRVARPVVIDSSQKGILEQWARSRSLPARQVERAKVVLLAAEGKTDLEIADRLRIGNHKAARWPKRFLEFGLSGSWNWVWLVSKRTRLAAVANRQLPRPSNWN